MATMTLYARPGAVKKKNPAKKSARKVVRKAVAKKSARRPVKKKNPVTSPVVILNGVAIAKFRSLLRAREYGQALANKTGKPVRIKI